MHTRSARRTLAGCLLAILVPGCAGTPGPSNWLPDVTKAPTDVYGAWCSASTVRGVTPTQLRGELIAVSPDSVFVLTTEGLRGLPHTSIRRAEVTYYASDAGAATVWAALGGVSTLSHGVGLVFTFPMWMVTGYSTNHSVARSAALVVPPATWLDVASYARFPRGLPAGVDRDRLKPR